jgi:hypothetical protein
MPESCVSAGALRSSRGCLGSARLHNELVGLGGLQPVEGLVRTATQRPVFFQPRAVGGRWRFAGRVAFGERLVGVGTAAAGDSERQMSGVLPRLGLRGRSRVWRGPRRWGLRATLPVALRAKILDEDECSLVVLVAASPVYHRRMVG